MGATPTSSPLIKTMYVSRSQMKEGVDHPRSHDDVAYVMVFYNLVMKNLELIRK